MTRAEDRPRLAVHRTVRVRPSAGPPVAWGIAEEVPVQIGFNGAAWMVMMATPRDLEDLAVGLAITEDALDGAGQIDAVTLTETADGVVADLSVDPEVLDACALRRHAQTGGTSCGLCGVATLAEAIRRPDASAGGRPGVGTAAIARAFAGLSDHQPINAATHSVHAAAWCALDGTIRLVREDVGRHNALDKLIGALARSTGLDGRGFLTLSSRCSFELVTKAAHTAASALATVSAPTGTALDLAAEVGLPLACRGPGGAVIRFDAASA